MVRDRKDKNYLPVRPTLDPRCWESRYPEGKQMLEEDRWVGAQLPDSMTLWGVTPVGEGAQAAVQALGEG